MPGWFVIPADNRRELAKQNCSNNFSIYKHHEEKTFVIP
jgi:hypothetical protein